MDRSLLLAFGAGLALVVGAVLIAVLVVSRGRQQGVEALDALSDELGYAALEEPGWAGVAAVEGRVGQRVATVTAARVERGPDESLGTTDEMTVVAVGVAGLSPPVALIERPPLYRGPAPRGRDARFPGRQGWEQLTEPGRAALHDLADRYAGVRLETPGRSAALHREGAWPRGAGAALTVYLAGWAPGAPAVRAALADLDRAALAIEGG